MQNLDNRLLSLHYMPGFALSTVHILSNLILKITVSHSTIIYSALQMKKLRLEKLK